MSRSKWKGPFVEPSLLRKIKQVQKIANKINIKELKGPRPSLMIKTWSRKSTILAEFIGLKFIVHNGLSFKLLDINEKIVGYKIGAFIPTRKPHIFKGKTLLKQQKKKK